MATDAQNPVRSLLRLMRDYLGAGRSKRRQRIETPESLQEFLDSRSSHVAQITLYGYLRTRSGTRFPALFEDDAFLVSINLAKWQMWLACLSDLSVYAGGLLRARTGVSDGEVAELMGAAIDAILDRTGVPEDSGPDFGASSEALRERIAGCAWSSVPDDDTAFSTSPDALVRWAPIVDSLKELDAEIVRNSVRFRWQEVRRDLRRSLDADAITGGAD